MSLDMCPIGLNWHLIEKKMIIESLVAPNGALTIEL